MRNACVRQMILTAALSAALCVVVPQTYNTVNTVLYVMLQTFT